MKEYRKSNKTKDIHNQQTNTRRSAISERPRCRVGHFGTKWMTIFCRRYSLDLSITVVM